MASKRKKTVAKRPTKKPANATPATRGPAQPGPPAPDPGATPSPQAAARGGIPPEAIPTGVPLDADAVQRQLREVSDKVERLTQVSMEVKGPSALAPVKLSDLMRGFQGAVVRANDAIRAGSDDGEDIEAMVIKRLDISLEAPIVETGHADDPVVMLPNLNSVDSDSPTVRLSFEVVSVPVMKGG